MNRSKAKVYRGAGQKDVKSGKKMVVNPSLFIYSQTKNDTLASSPCIIICLPEAVLKNQSGSSVSFEVESAL